MTPAREQVKTICGALVTPASVIGQKNIHGLGSCVTFDSFWKAMPKLTQAGGVSALSAAGLSVDFDDDILQGVELTNWQETVLHRDFAGKLYDDNMSNAEIVILDIVVERYGVMVRGGQVITINIAFMKAIKRARAQQHGFSFIPMTSDLFFELWKISVDKMIEQLQSDSDVILVNKVFAATRSNRFKYMNLPNRIRMNASLRRMYAYLEKKNAVNMVEYKKSELIAKRDHSWGRTPFHYVDSHYDVIHRKLDEIYK